MPTNNIRVTPARLVRAAADLAQRRHNKGRMAPEEWRAAWLATLDLLSGIRGSIVDWGAVTPQQFIAATAASLGVEIVVLDDDPVERAHKLLHAALVAVEEAAEDSAVREDPAVRAELEAIVTEAGADLRGPLAYLVEVGPEVFHRQRRR